jgi:sugar-specific transcriptional regulator TrmB
MNYQTIFTRLGYPKHSAEIYQVLSESVEPLLVTDLAKKGQVPRMTVYRVLASLCADKIVIPVASGRRTTYQAAHPSVLEKIISKDSHETNKVLTKLASNFEKDISSPVRFLSGADGITEAFDDVITRTKRGGLVYRYTSEKDLSEVNAYLAPDYRERRDAKKLERLVISNPVSGSQKRKRLERFIRCIPSDADRFDQNIIQFVYGNRVSFIDVTKQEVMIIENPALAAFQRVIFKQLYKKLDKN